jgi:hypothetical protein
MRLGLASRLPALAAWGALPLLACSSSEPQPAPPAPMSSVAPSMPSGPEPAATLLPMGSGGTSSEGVGGPLGLDPGMTPGAAGAGMLMPAPSGDDFVSDVAVVVHDRVNTILVVTWNQRVAAESTWLEFGFEDGIVMKSRPRAGALGAHRDVVLGVPGETDVSLRVVSKQSGNDFSSRDYQGRTEAVPSGPNGMPVPTILSYDAALASPDRWLLGSVENSQGGCGPECYNRWTYWTYIMDRKGRIVWYYADPASNATSSFQRRARDGEYLWIEKRPYGRPGPREVLKTTLDDEYSETIAVANLADSIDVTPDGSLLYDANNTLRELSRAGMVRDIWSCRTQFGNNFECYTNTINFVPATNSVWMSYPEENTIVEVNRATGQLVASYGEAPGSYTFSPDTWQFEFQHFPNISEAGTLLVSSHMPGYADTYTPVAGQHAFLEFEIDRQNRRLVEKWSYNAGQEWAMYKGMAIRLPNGNTLANYGSGGVIREITPDKRTAFWVKFDAPTGDDFYNKMVGHNELIDDLYALNGGGPNQ